MLFAAALLFVVAFLPGSGQVEATGLWTYVCYHNDLPYALVTVPTENSPPNCPDDDSAWNSVKDPHDGLNCTGQEGTGPCHKDRHIDCEYDAMPGHI